MFYPIRCVIYYCFYNPFPDSYPKYLPDEYPHTTRFGQPINLTVIQIYLHIFAFQVFISTAQMREPNMEI